MIYLGHPWFHDGTNPQSKAYVIQKLNEVWNIPHTNKHNLITTGFKHIFFGEKRSSVSISYFALFNKAFILDRKQL
jgi:hypothetical protein